MSDASIDPWFTLALFVIAGLYAAVGQAGATGYLAAMGMIGFEPSVMKPTALALNLVVAGIATVQFRRAGQFSWRNFYPFAVLGFPFSLLGGAVHLPERLYYPLVGVILLLAAVQMFRAAGRSQQSERSVTAVKPPFWPALLIGALIGFVSGTTGTGGGVFLAPLILSMNWVDVRRTAAVTAAYNLLNSAAALAGSYATLDRLPPELPVWLLAVACGGVFGATLGARHLPDQVLRYLLAVILLLSGLRLVF